MQKSTYNRQSEYKLNTWNDSNICLTYNRLNICQTVRSYVRLLTHEAQKGNFLFGQKTVLVLQLLIHTTKVSSHNKHLKLPQHSMVASDLLVAVNAGKEWFPNKLGTCNYILRINYEYGLFICLPWINNSGI